MSTASLDTERDHSPAITVEHFNLAMKAFKQVGPRLLSTSSKEVAVASYTPNSTLTPFFPVPTFSPVNVPKPRVTFPPPVAALPSPIPNPSSSDPALSIPSGSNAMEDFYKQDAG